MSAAESIAEYGQIGQLIVLESTTYPGTTDEIILPRLASRSGAPGGDPPNRGYQVGRDFFVAFSPEHVDPGNPRYIQTVRSVGYRFLPEAHV